MTMSSSSTFILLLLFFLLASAIQVLARLILGMTDSVPQKFFTSHQGIIGSTRVGSLNSYSVFDLSPHLETNPANAS